MKHTYKQSTIEDNHAFLLSARAVVGCVTRGVTRCSSCVGRGLNEATRSAQVLSSPHRVMASVVQSVRRSECIVIPRKFGTLQKRPPCREQGLLRLLDLGCKELLFRRNKSCLCILFLKILGQFQHHCGHYCMPRMQRIKTSHCVGRKSLALWLFFLNLVGCSNDAGWVDVCVNRSFTHDHAADELGCTDHYLPRFAVLKTTGKAPPLVPALAPPLEDVNVTTFLVIMQGGRVGSTWLYELLDGHPHVSCEGEVFNEHPCQGHSNVRHQKQMQRFIEACNTTACGFKIMFNVVDNRISKAALNYMLQRPNLKVVCLTRRNVYEQVRLIHSISRPHGLATAHSDILLCILDDLVFIQEAKEVPSAPKAR